MSFHEVQIIKLVEKITFFDISLRNTNRNISNYAEICIHQIKDVRFVRNIIGFILEKQGQN